MTILFILSLSRMKAFVLQPENEKCASEVS